MDGDIQLSHHKPEETINLLSIVVEKKKVSCKIVASECRKS